MCDFMELMYNIRMCNNHSNEHTALVIMMVVIVIVCVLFEQNVWMYSNMYVCVHVC